MKDEGRQKEWLKDKILLPFHLKSFHISDIRLILQGILMTPRCQGNQQSYLILGFTCDKSNQKQSNQ